MPTPDRRLLFPILVVGALTGACGSDRTTESFSGTLTQGNSASHTIAVVEDGEIDATLSSTDPAATVGLKVGQPAADGTCTALVSNEAAVAGTVVSADATEAGSYCVSVYDVGNLSGSTSYGLSVIHP